MGVCHLHQSKYILFLSCSFQILQNDSIEIDQLMKQNAENLQEQAESLKELR